MSGKGPPLTSHTPLVYVLRCSFACNLGIPLDYIPQGHPCELYPAVLPWAYAGLPGSATSNGISPENLCRNEQE